MTEKQLQENQQELFPGLSGEVRPPDSASMIPKNQKPILFSTTLEQLLLAGIVLILLLCFVFFLGVLRGRVINSAAVLKPAAILAPPVPAVHILPSAKILPPIPTPTVRKESSFVVINESSVKPYTIQVLTTKKKDYAEVEASWLRKNGASGWMTKSGEFYVVCTGSYANKEEAKKDLLQLKSKYKTAYLRRR